MKLTENIKKQLINKFKHKKNIEPCYENFNHNKVCQKGDIFLAIPEGTKCFLWFTIFKNKSFCFLIEVSDNYTKNGIIRNIQILPLNFHYTICNESVFYGTIFYKSLNNNNIINNEFRPRYIALEDVLEYKHEIVSFSKYSKKLEIFNSFFTNDILSYNINNANYYFNNNTFIIGLPLMNYNYKDILENIKNNVITYKIKYICYRYLHNSPKKCIFIQYNPLLYKKNNSAMNENSSAMNENSKIGEYNTKNNISFREDKKHSVFIVKADIKTDIYNLYRLDNNNEEIFYDIAYIPDYKTSVMMN
jgi:hypothetical protein